MSQKEMIVNLLKSNESMTQGDLAAAIYGDKNHSSNIYASSDNTLKGLDASSPFYICNKSSVLQLNTRANFTTSMAFVWLMSRWRCSKS